MKNTDEEMVKMMKETFKTHARLDHNNIIKAEELFINEDSETMYCVMELCSYPCLQRYLKSHKNISEKEIQVIIF